MDWIKRNLLKIIKYTLGIYVFIVLPLMIFGPGWAVAGGLFTVIIYRYNFIEEFPQEFVLTLFGSFLIGASLYVQDYSDYGDPMGYVVRDEPVWWLLSLGVLVLISIFFSIKNKI